VVAFVCSGFKSFLLWNGVYVACYSPISGWYSRFVNPKSGKRPVTFSFSEAFTDLSVTLPCGQCIGCRLDRSRQWAIRCVHEASLYENNCFVTLTYRDECLPKDGSLDPDAVPLFMKRLRKRFGDGIRVFYCGEYGDNFGRPHYHLIIFNFDFLDKYPFSRCNDQVYFRSKSLEELWTFGHSIIGSVTFESAAYVARYVTKKITGKKAVTHYNDIDFSTGEILRERLPEFARPSRRPGVGRPWLEKYGFSEVYPSDFVVVRGIKMRPPKYYDYVFSSQCPEEFAKVVSRRKRFAVEHADDNTWERLLVKEEIQHRKFDLLYRGYENEK